MIALANLVLADCSHAADGTVTVSLHAPVPDGAIAADPATEPLTASLHDIAGRVLAADTVPEITLIPGAHRYAFRFTVPRPHPLADSPSWLLTLGRGGEWIRIWVAAPDQPAGDPPDPGPPPVAAAGQAGIDYTARDFAGLRTMMQSRLAQNLQGESAWALSHPADPLMTVAEVLAARGDYLSYQQDAVGTEAYLSTARRSLSVRRHARLLDYTINDGCNARTWVAITVTGQPAATAVLPAGLRVVTSQPGTTGPVLTAAAPASDALAAGTTAFETMEPLSVQPQLSELSSILSGQSGKVLSQGTWQLPVSGRAAMALIPGRVLIFEQLTTPDGTPPFGAHAVRLLSVTPTRTNQVTIAWHPEDALPRPLVVPSTSGSLKLYGNVVLADHGWTQDSTSALIPGTVPDGGDYRPSIAIADPIFAAPPPRPKAGWGGQGPASQIPSATASLTPDPRTTTAAVTLTAVTVALPDTTVVTLPAGGERWRAARDLLRAPANARLFAAEPEEGEQDGGGPRLLLRFGDGVLGRQPAPGTAFQAQARVTLGQTGLLKARTLTQAFITPDLGKQLKGVHIQIQDVINPLPATPQPPEPAMAARLFAPGAFRAQRRGVTSDDWTALATAHPLVTKAGAEPPASPDGTGCTVAIETKAPQDETFQIVQDDLMRFAVIGAPPVFVPFIDVPVTVALAVYVRRDADLRSLRQRLGRRLGTGSLADGTAAFFHPSRLPPGRSIVLADLVSAIRTEPDVEWVNLNPETDPRLRFRRPDDLESSSAAFARGVIPIRRIERARVGNDPLRPQGGIVNLYLIPVP